MSGYIGTQPVPQATQTRDAFTCTAGQTSFATSGYTPSFLDVYLNGIKLAAADYTASNGSDVVLASGAALDDILEVVAYSSFEIVTDTVTNAGTVLNLDRTGSDGTILDLKKDGSTVGSIGSRSGVVSYLTLDPRSTDNGFGVTTSSQELVACNNVGSVVDGLRSLGTPTARWKDLYLSGGVYLGGTGSDNLLSDYEQGTWTPTSAVGLTINYANYTKVGRLVFINVDFSVATTSSTAELAVSLPFGTADAYGTGSFNYQTTAFTDAKVYLGTPGLSVRASASGGNLSYAQVSARRFILSATYRTS